MRWWRLLPLERDGIRFTKSFWGRGKMLRQSDEGLETPTRIPNVTWMLLRWGEADHRGDGRTPTAGRMGPQGHTQAGADTCRAPVEGFLVFVDE